MSQCGCYVNHAPGARPSQGNDFPGCKRFSGVHRFMNGSCTCHFSFSMLTKLTYVVEKLETPLEDGTQYIATEQHDILLIVKILMLALDRATRRRSAEGN